MSNSILINKPQVLYSYNVTGAISTTVTNSMSTIERASSIAGILSTPSSGISVPTCIGFVVLILTTVGGNTLVLLALYLDKRLHSPSFYLIANMAMADLLLGLFVLPLSSTLELLNGRWIFGETLCNGWLAFDVLCCTASIIALMAVSVDRYIGVTRPLNYSSIMTTRRTIYLIIVVWTVSILTSVVPLFGLTDREKKSNDINLENARIETCEVNKNSFYTIFSSLISFYIPVVILLILYSRVYQEANMQGQKLEKEKRRLYEIDYQIASEHVRRRETVMNGHSFDSRSPIPFPRKQRALSTPDSRPEDEVTVAFLNKKDISKDELSPDRTLSVNDGVKFRKDYADLRSPHLNDDTLESGSSLTYHLNQARRSIGQRISSTWKRSSQSNINHCHQSGHMSTKDELLIIKRKLHNLRREKKAFRTLGLIFGVLLICWLPFFVTLPVTSILKHFGMINDEKAENSWFKFTFWLGYCNSALNPFVYAFSNRAIQRAFREALFRRFCCCNLRCCLCRHLCPKKSREYQNQPSYQRAYSDSLTAQISQIGPRRRSSYTNDVIRTPPIVDGTFEAVNETPRTGGPVVSFADFVVEKEKIDVSSKEEKVIGDESKLTLNK